MEHPNLKILDELATTQSNWPEQAKQRQSICAQSELSKSLDKLKKSSPFDTGDKGLKR